MFLERHDGTCAGAMKCMGRKFNGPAAKGRRRRRIGEAAAAAAAIVLNYVPALKMAQQGGQCGASICSVENFFRRIVVFVLHALHWIALAAPARTSDREKSACMHEARVRHQIMQEELSWSIGGADPRPAII